MPSFLTSKDQLLWSQRIEKERINEKVNPESYQIRSAINHLDVAKRFKPGHIDPKNPAVADGFHPASKYAKELKMRLEKAEAPLRDRVMFPETCMQEQGWYQKDPARGPEKEGRTSIAGALPIVGIGWSHKPGNVSSLEPLFSGTITHALPEEVPRPIQKVERPPFAFMSLEAARAVNAKNAQRGTATVRGGSHVGADKRAQLRASDPGSSSLSAAGRSASTPALSSRSTGKAGGAGAEDLTSSNPGLEEAMNRQRIFMNRNPKYSWYVPLGNCDVSAFVDNYTKAFGLPYYGRANMGGAGSKDMPLWK